MTSKEIIGFGTTAKALQPRQLWHVVFREDDCPIPLERLHSFWKHELFLDLPWFHAVGTRAPQCSEAFLFRPFLLGISSARVALWQRRLVPSTAHCVSWHKPWGKEGSGRLCGDFIGRRWRLKDFPTPPNTCSPKARARAAEPFARGGATLFPFSMARVSLTKWPPPSAVARSRPGIGIPQSLLDVIHK